jgi:hypothetical protein
LWAIINLANINSPFNITNITNIPLIFSTADCFHTDNLSYNLSSLNVMMPLNNRAAYDNDDDDLHTS